MSKRSRDDAAPEAKRAKSDPEGEYIIVDGSSGIPTVRQPAPAFAGTAVVDGQFKDVSLADYAGKWVVLFFYPLDFTFVCPTEICAFNDKAAEFEALGCHLIACSIDSKFSHLAYSQQPRKEGGLAPVSMPLLADVTKDISKAYGVLIEDRADGDCGVALRGTFIIDPKGVLRHITINDLPVGRNPDEVLRLVQALQFTDEHGEVCPASWKPGKPTMVDDPAKSKTYFAEHA